MNRPVYRLLSGDFGASFELRTLMRRTAEAFGTAAPKAAGRSAAELLRDYAQLTADEAMRAIRSGQDLEPLHRRLYQMTYRLGSRLRRWLRPKDEQDRLAIIVLLYGNIGITIGEAGPREFLVRECYFSSFYTPDVCAVVSAIDQGIFAGVYQGGTLTFRERITEGHEVCRACLQGR